VEAHSYDKTMSPQKGFIGWICVIPDSLITRKNHRH